MATSQPPLYYFNGITYNDAFFNTNTSAGGGITQSFADNQYLARTGTSVSSIASDTTFLGALTATSNANSIVSKSNVANNIATTGTTSATVYTIPFVPLNATSTSQTLYVDSGAGVNHLNYTPSTNTLSVGSTTNGNITVIGTASSVSIAGTGTALSIPNGTVTIGTGFLNVSGASSTITASGTTTAIAVPSGNIVCSGTGNVIQAPNGTITLGTSPNMTYTTLPSLVNTQIGYYTFIPATLPVSVTTQASGANTVLSGATLLQPGIYSINIQVYYIFGTTATGMINNIVSGLSTNTSSFSTPSGLGYYYMTGFNYIPASPTAPLIFQITKVFTIPTAGNYYFLSQINYTGITPQMSSSQNYIQLVKIA